MTTYVLTLFKIVSEIRIQDAVSQEIDKRVLKEFDTYSEAVDYLKGIKNQMMMYNFPFAMVQEFERDLELRILDQELYLFDDETSKYQALDNMAGLTLSTRRKLHDFKGTAVIDMQN